MEVRKSHSTNTRPLPWWTWIAPIIIFHLGTEISLSFKYAQGVADIYLPTALSIILVNWWGPWRVIPAMYINAMLSTGLWGIENLYQWPIYALPETLFTTISWLLFSKLANGKYWFPDVRNLIVFIVLGILVPICAEISFLEALLIYFGEHSTTDFWMFVSRNCLGEFTSSFGLTLPLMYFVTPYLQRKRLLYQQPFRRIKREWVRVNRAEIIIVYSILTGLTFLIPFERFWFVYGFFSLYVAIRYGFSQAIVMNIYIFLITYIIPTLLHRTFIDQLGVVNIFLGMLLLYVFAAIAGRTISDLKNVEEKLNRKNEEMEQTNEELDRFVYSVSHDLSAPLKSILGLVHISRIDKQTETESYLGKIEISVQKLESFISEILDYSRNKRMRLQMESVKLKDLCMEILDNLKFMEGYNAIRIDLDQIKQNEVTTDKARLKIILNNLLSNAIKFQKKFEDHLSYIRISSRPTNHSVVIEVEDNGEGIRPELKPKIFDMFFRGTDKTTGSGLGLYIARETAEKMKGTISVHSEYGQGTTFTLRLPKN